MQSPDLLSRRENRRFDPLRWLSYAGMFALGYALFYVMALRPSSDISIHATWAAECDIRDFDSFFHHGTHIMWHVLVWLLLQLNIALPVAAALVTAACKTVELMLVNRLFSMTLNVKREWVTLLAVVTCMVSSLYLPIPELYGVGTTVNTWHSCTQLIAMVWMILCVSYVAHCYDEFERQLPNDEATLPWKKALTMGAMLCLSLAAKPTFMQAFLPAAGLYFGVMWLRHPKNSRFFIRVLLCVLPSVVLMILQYLYYFGIIVPLQSSMVLEASSQKLLKLLLGTLVLQAFPIYVLIACRKRGNAGTLYWLTLVFDVVGIVEYLILGESGRRASDGNFGWGMLGAALMMWIVSVIRYVRCVMDEREALGADGVRAKVKPWRVGGVVLIVWHFVSGVAYVVYLIANDVTF